MGAEQGYAAWVAGFQWEIPNAFNVATAILERHAPDQLALIDARDDAPVRQFTYGELDVLSNRLANILFEEGIAPEDRVAVLLPQRAETAIAHFAIYKTAAIALPLSGAFGLEALRLRLKDAAVRFVFADRDSAERVRMLEPELPELERVFDVDAQAFGQRMDAAEPWCAHEVTHSEDPALMLYTSGTTGASKAAVHAHRVLLGHLPGVEMVHDGMPQPGDRFWTSSDWALISGLLDVLLPSLYLGVPVVAGPGGAFDPHRVVRFLAEHKIRNAGLPAAALRQMRQAEPDCSSVALRSIASGGEALGDVLVDWVRQSFGCEVNACYGQTEAPLLVAGMASSFARRDGAIGRVVPGHFVAIVDDQGSVVAWDEPGLIAVHRPDPCLFLGYWDNPEATQAKFRGDWLITGDVGRMDADGYVTFLGRDDDVINAGGYHIGPAEVEAVIGAHADVAQVAVVGVPDDEARGEVVVACVVPRAGVVGTAELAEALQERVRSGMGVHATPRRVVFRQSLPLTATGNVLRRDLRAFLEVDGGA